MQQLAFDLNHLEILFGQFSTVAVFAAAALGAVLLLSFVWRLLLFVGKAAVVLAGALLLVRVSAAALPDLRDSVANGEWLGATRSVVGSAYDELRRIALPSQPGGTDALNLPFLVSDAGRSSPRQAAKPRRTTAGSLGHNGRPRQEPKVIVAARIPAK